MLLKSSQNSHKKEKGVNGISQSLVDMVPMMQGRNKSNLSWLTMVCLINLKLFKENMFFPKEVKICSE